MPTPDWNIEARRLITEKCLIAADVDKTVLEQGHNRERQQFLDKVAPQLLLAASYGTNLAFLTGNSIHEFSSRFLRWLIDQLCHTDHLELLDRFHFFCNSGGVYARLSHKDKWLRKILTQQNTDGKLKDRIFRAITVPSNGGSNFAIRPCFIDAAYIERSMIPQDDAARITSVLEDAAQSYLDVLKAKRSTYEKSYDLSVVCDNTGFKAPHADMRIVDYGSNASLKKATVQITLKPILSFRQAYKPEKLFGKDERSKLIQIIQAKLDEKGLNHYIARPGGRSSIDVTLEKLDKAYALEFLIDRLNLQGQLRRGQKLGYNTIYFGDEVIVGGGNDYAVTRIPGLLVFAVNPDKNLIPFLSHIFVPSAILERTDATADVLTHFNNCALRLLKNFDHMVKAKKQSDIKTALEVLKEEIFAARIREKIADLKHTHHTSVDDWQTLHAFVTLMCRNDPAARQWLSILINELDAIMTQLATNTASLQPALGTSHPDW
jgi:hydroxymethylpyrimidine pyrophosphatase-like HAD family hydrolase